MPGDLRNPQPPARKKRDSRFLRYLFTAIGGTAIISAAVNLYSALELLEPSDEEALGISRNYIVATYAGIFIAGVALVWVAQRKRR